MRTAQLSPLLRTPWSCLLHCASMDTEGTDIGSFLPSAESPKLLTAQQAAHERAIKESTVELSANACGSLAFVPWRSSLPQESVCWAQAAQEAAAKDAAAKAELGADCQRLRAHIADLETRKRAPLYQKRQEEELKVRVEGTTFCYAC